uniref:Putative DNA excision repair protein n=1 Tax=Trypanosoma congolense (strain IL3000) TaxID=1068625 RepID=G0UQ55_TRYCI|nr:putative DNA excision repair protein [Trypanosoma congolense IL3000]
MYIYIYISFSLFHFFNSLGMSDELTELDLKWVEESALRHDVEAGIEALADPVVAADEAELRKRWAALEKGEHSVADIKERLKKATAGVVVFSNSSGSRVNDDKGKEDVSVLQFMLRKAESDLEDKAKALRRWQVEMEARKRRRIEEAKRHKHSAELQSAAARVYNKAGTAHHPLTAQQPPLVGRSTTPTPPTVASVTSTAADHPGSSMAAPSTAENSGECGNRLVPGPLQPSLRPGNFPPFVPLNVSEYACGPILPSAYRVTLTSRDVRYKAQKYADDSDISVYNARQRKRKRLEGAVASLAALRGSSTPQEGAEGEGIEEKVNHLVKREGGLSPRGGLRPKENGGTSPLDAIDVDAVMEEPDDVAAGLLKQIKKNVRGASGEYRRYSGGDRSGVEEPHEYVEICRGISLPVSLYQRLLEHQREGLAWLLNLHMQRMGGILGDDMGLGKTVQVAAMLNALHHSNQLHGPCLIVAPVTVLRQWVVEMHRWAPYMRTCVMHVSSASGMSRDELIASVKGTPAVLLTTYSAVREHCCLLHSACFQYIVLDEGHKISNPEATVTIAVKSFPTPHRLILSGTPVQNTLKELWCLFDFVRPGLLGTMTRFVEEFEDPISSSKSLRASPLALATAVERARVLHDTIAPFLLRRLKRQVMVDSLPEKYERVIRCPLSDSQLEAYIELLTSPSVQKLLGKTMSYTKLVGGLDRDGRDASGSLHISGRCFQLMYGGKSKGHCRHELFCVMHELRQICNHVDIFRMRRASSSGYDDELDADSFPELGNARDGGNSFKKAGGKGSPSFSLRSNLPVNFAGSSKLQTLRKLLTFWKSSGKRALAFSQTRAMLDIIENMCEQEGFTYIRMDGNTSTLRRQELVDRFNEDDSIVVALLTTRVGGVGVNLIGADRVVIFDPDWNPVTDEQARERAWRIGQTRDVGVYRLISSGTVEEAVLRRQLAKTYVKEKVLHDPTLQRFFHEQGSLAETFFLGVEYDDRVPQGKKHALAIQEILPILEKDEGGEEATLSSVLQREREAQDAGGEQIGGPTKVKSETQDAVLASVYKVRVAPEASTQPHTAAATPPSSCNKSEVALLQDLVNGQNVQVSVDSSVRHLARMSASDAMLRVSNTARTLEQQRQEAYVKLNST